MTTTAIVLLLISGLFVAYTYFGYAFLLGWISRLRSNEVSEPARLADEDCPRLAVLICAFNESAMIGAKIKNCLDLDYPAEKLRVVVVSDGSDDGMNDIVGGFAERGVSLIISQQRRGKASCINLAMEQIDEDLVLMADVRQRLSRNSARDLASHFVDPLVGAVTGELQLETSSDGSGLQSFDHGVSGYWSHEVRLRKAEASVHSVVGVTGAIYALRRSAFQPIPDGTILDDVLIPMNAVMNGLRVRFDSRAIAYDRAATEVNQERRRKIRTLSGNFQLLALRPHLLSAAHNPILWMFLSHKIFRLFVPAAMLTALLTAAVLHNTHWLFASCFWAQIVAYLVSLVPERLFTHIAIGPVRTIRTFVHMHWFVVLGFREFLLNRNAHLWDVSPSGD